MTTLADDWRGDRERDPQFSAVERNGSVDVEATTLDALIERFGMPAFVKIDVEGAEPEVLAGLSQPVSAVSFEYLPRALDYVATGVARLCALGPYRFNWSPGESYRLVADRWLRDDELAAALETTDAQRRSGDVYARLDSPTSR